MLTHHKHILWDWNGTLLDDVALCVDIMNGILARKRLAPMTVERYRTLFTFPVRDYYLKLGFDFDDESFEELGAEFMAHYERRRHESDLYPGARDALARVRAAGIGQSVLSACYHDTLVELVRHFDLEPFFDRLMGIDSIYAPGKIAQGRRLVAELGCSPANVVLIGDTAHDHEVARELGADCILIARGHHAHEIIAPCGVPVLDSITELFAQGDSHAAP